MAASDRHHSEMQCGNEIMSRHKNAYVNASLEGSFFSAWISQRLLEQPWKEIVDKRLEISLTLKDWKQIKKAIMVVVWCIQIRRGYVQRNPISPDFKHKVARNALG
ncbi:hypothetical protein KC19_10G108400 [Ceratodon purpureus]|uniref:Uncharacterized protein n=1 Tax=Ceratodon purpureus TaxID=3225 RepID=A0A8T0GKE4_CERPU|nr:hypothetical protein KC19_10G108400 [Ceratodon purpureus]